MRWRSPGRHDAPFMAVPYDVALPWKKIARFSECAQALQCRSSWRREVTAVLQLNLHAMAAWHHPNDRPAGRKGLSEAEG